MQADDEIGLFVIALQPRLATAIEPRQQRVGQMRAEPAEEAPRRVHHAGMLDIAGGCDDHAFLAHIRGRRRRGSCRG